MGVTMEWEWYGFLVRARDMSRLSPTGVPRGWVRTCKLAEYNISRRLRRRFDLRHVTSTNIASPRQRNGAGNNDTENSDGSLDHAI